MKKRISVISVLILCFLVILPITAFAVSGSATLTGPDTVRAGDTITLTLNLSGKDIYGAEGVLSYDKNVLELKEMKQKVGGDWVVEFNGNNFVAYDNNLSKPISSKTAVLTVSFKVKNVAVGTNIKVSYNNLVVSDGSNEVGLGTVSYSVKTAAPKSKDNALKSLTVSNATISPKFSAGTTSYTAEVPFSVSKLDVKATANDGKAKVSVDSPNLTPGGTTKVTVTVTAENGDKKVYTISVKRAQDPNYVPSGNNSLSGITVDGFKLSPVFSAENTSYVIWLPYETENVTVSSTPADSRASVRVEGGENLKAGADNEIKVICKAENGTEKIYTIIAKRAAAHGSSNEPTQPTEPAQTPTEPSKPTKDGGIPWWSLLIVGVITLGAGFAGGYFGKDLIKKKEG